MEFVILRHSHQNLPTHFDLMFEQTEQSQTLATFSFTIEPDILMKKGGSCRKIFDHQRRFLIYQGQVNDRLGWVKRVAEGQVEIIDNNPFKLKFISDNFYGNFELLPLKHGKYLLIPQTAQPINS